MHVPMQRFGLFSVLTAILFALAGCGGSPIVGKWNLPAASAAGGKVDTTFNADNTFKMDIQSPKTGGQSPISGGSLTMTGAYKLEKDQLTMTPSNIVAPGLPPQMLQMMKSSMASAGQTLTVKFVDNDTLQTVGPSGQTGTMRRVK